MTPTGGPQWAGNALSTGVLPPPQLKPGYKLAEFTTTKYASTPGFSSGEQDEGGGEEDIKKRTIGVKQNIHGEGKADVIHQVHRHACTAQGATWHTRTDMSP